MNEQTITLSETEYVDLRGAVLSHILVLRAVANFKDANSYEKLMSDIDQRWDAEYEARRVVTS